jgi:hypothetical protein
MCNRSPDASSMLKPPRESDEARNTSIIMKQKAPDLAAAGDFDIAPLAFPY